MMMGHPVSKMKEATFQRRPPRTHGHCTHTLDTKNEESNDLQESLSNFWPYFYHFGVFGL